MSKAIFQEVRLFIACAGTSAVASRCYYLNLGEIFPLVQRVFETPSDEDHLLPAVLQSITSKPYVSVGCIYKIISFQTLTNWLTEHPEIIFLGQSQFQPEIC